MTNDGIKEKLVDCILQSVSKETNEFHWDAFFRRWYRESGTPAFFLFKRHLGVTNTQYTELLSLIRTHSTFSPELSDGLHLVFHTTEQIKNGLYDAMSVILERGPGHLADAVSTFVDLYQDIFLSTVAIDMFYCSCAVFMPPGVGIDLKRICADAGYIHSTGYTIYVRNIRKAKKQDFEESLQSYLADIPRNQTPVPLVVYAHEDFSDYDRAAKEQIGRGIEYTKLHLEKMNLGSFRLAQIIDELRQEFREQLVIPEPGPYNMKHNFKAPKTLWLICDRSISDSDLRSPGTQRYYICYEQVAKNERPFEKVL